MLKNEANWIGHALRALPPHELSPLLNIGSSTLRFRTRVAPFIDSEIFSPLTKSGVDVIHCDIKRDAGVDIVGDIFDDATLSKLKLVRPQAILCSNMLEHVTDRVQLCRRLAVIAPAGTYLIVTVPRSYPYHADPIDTLFRPTTQELTSLFPDWRAITFDEVQCPGFGNVILRSPVVALKTLILSVMPLPHPKRWLSACHRWFWLFRPYLVSCLVLQKLQVDGAADEPLLRGRS